MTRIKRLLKWTGLAVAGGLLLFLVAAFAGSHMGVNRSWRPAPLGVTIYVIDNGIHTALIVPAAAEGVDWSMVFRPTDLPDHRLAGQWMVIGWGDRAFFLNTPSWSEARPQTLVSALFGSGGSVVHVDHINQPIADASTRAITITPDAYKRLSASLRAALVLDENGHPAAIPGYGARDVFYPARGNYSLIHTCNNWTAEMLGSAGIVAPVWSPFSGGVMRWYPAAASQ